MAKPKHIKESKMPKKVILTLLIISILLGTSKILLDFEINNLGAINSDVGSYNASNFLKDTFTVDNVKYLPIIYKTKEEQINRAELEKEFGSLKLNIKNISEGAIGTGTKIDFSNGYEDFEYTLLIYGDANKDGQVNILDAIAVVDHLLWGGNNTLNGVFRMAANVEEADKENLDANDAVRIVDFIANGKEIVDITKIPASDMSKDDEAPTIELIGEENVIVRLGEAYNDKGARAYDNLDPAINSRIVTTIKKGLKKVDKIDTNVKGTYKIYYDVTDANGNKAETSAVRTVEVIDESDMAPEIRFNEYPGEENIKIKYKSTFDKGATAWDRETKKQIDIEITGEVNTNIPGIYEVKYKTAKGENGKINEVTRKIEVVDVITDIRFQVTSEFNNKFIDGKEITPADLNGIKIYAIKEYASHLVAGTETLVELTEEELASGNINIKSKEEKIVYDRTSSANNNDRAFVVIATVKDPIDPEDETKFTTYESTNKTIDENKNLDSRGIRINVVKNIETLEYSYKTTKTTINCFENISALEVTTGDNEIQFENIDKLNLDVEKLTNITDESGEIIQINNGNVEISKTLKTGASGKTGISISFLAKYPGYYLLKPYVLVNNEKVYPKTANIVMTVKEDESVTKIAFYKDAQKETEPISVGLNVLTMKDIKYYHEYKKGDTILDTREITKVQANRITIENKLPSNLTVNRMTRNQEGGYSVVDGNSALVTADVVKLGMKLTGSGINENQPVELFKITIDNGAADDYTKVITGIPKYMPDSINVGYTNNNAETINLYTYRNYTENTMAIPYNGADPNTYGKYIKLDTAEDAYYTLIPISFMSEGKEFTFDDAKNDLKISAVLEDRSEPGYVTVIDNLNDTYRSKFINIKRYVNKTDGTIDEASENDNVDYIGVAVPRNNVCWLNTNPPHTALMTQDTWIDNYKLKYITIEYKKGGTSSSNSSKVFYINAPDFADITTLQDFDLIIDKYKISLPSGDIAINNDSNSVSSITNTQYNELVGTLQIKAVVPNDYADDINANIELSATLVSKGEVGTNNQAVLTFSVPGFSETNQTVTVRVTG